MPLHESWNVCSHVLDRFFTSESLLFPEGWNTWKINAPNQLTKSTFQSFPKSRERRPCTTGGLRACRFSFQENTTPGGCTDLFLLSGWSSRNLWNLLVLLYPQRKTCRFSDLCTLLGIISTPRFSDVYTCWLCIMVHAWLLWKHSFICFAVLWRCVTSEHFAS